MNAITTALSALETTPRADITDSLDGMTYAQLTGLYDALETVRVKVERLQSIVETEIGFRQWEGVTA